MNRCFFIFIFFFLSQLMAQNLGFRVGLTTATPTGNNDAYKFNFLESLSPGYKLGLFGHFVLSDVIILKPEISYRKYKINQQVESFPIDLNIPVVYNFKQIHGVLSADLNFDIELSNYFSFIFGAGVDYMNSLVIESSVNDFTESIVFDLSDHTIDERVDPFANIGVCMRFNNSILIDLEYRHLLDNWGTGDLVEGNQIVSADNGSVKLHMINLSLAVLF